MPIAGPFVAAPAAGILLGAIIGSFAGTVAVRLPAGRSIVHGRSACDTCHHPIGAADLVPLGSWLVLRGRCRHCGAAIGVDQFLAELGCALAGGIAFAQLPSAGVLQVLAIALFGWQLVLLALMDARHFWLPLPLVAMLGATGLARAALVPSALEPTDAMIQATLGGVIGWALLAGVAGVYRLLRRRPGLGGGDPLLLAAIGTWLGPPGTVHCLLAAAVLGLVAAVALRGLGRNVTGATALPLGSLMAAAAWPLLADTHIGALAGR